MILINKKNKSKSTKVLPEILLENRLDKDIQKMMYPVNLLLKIFLLSKYTIKDDYIAPKRKVFTALTIFIVASVYVMVLHRVFFQELEDNMGTNNNDIITLLFLFFFVFYCVGFTILFFLNIVHSDMNITIILLIQKIYRGLDFSGSLKKVTFWNWISILSAVGINIFLQLLYDALFNQVNFIDILLDGMFITFDIHLVYAIIVITLLRKYLEKWIADVLVFNDGDEKFSAHFFALYRNILEAYSLYKTIFQILILFHTADTFFRSLSYFSVMLQILTMPVTYREEERPYTLGICMVFIWLLKDIFLVIIQCVQCEKFYMAVEEAETACIQRLKNKNYRDDEEILCRNVIQLNRASFSKMSACGLFYINASLPLHLMALLTNYIIVMLQSFFL